MVDEYKVVVGYMPLFEKKVNQALKEGWELTGGFTQTFDPETGHMLYAQVLVKTPPLVSDDADIDLAELERALAQLDEHEFIREVYGSYKEA